VLPIEDGKEGMYDAEYIIFPGGTDELPDKVGIKSIVIC
jgi:hypothetical protein